MNLLLLTVFSALTPALHLPGEDGGNWPQFMGPGGQPVAESSIDLSQLGAESGSLWRVELPKGSSSPCIWGDRIFISGTSEKGSVMMALDRRTGEQLWVRTQKAPALDNALHVDSNAAAPTACTDGERVIFYFGQYGLIALDMEGEPLWEKKLPVPASPFGLGTSPILVDDMVILTRDGCPDSSVYAFDVKDGKELWRVIRFGYTYSFGTPFLWENSKRRELVVAGTQRLTGLNLADGKELWQVSGLTSFVCTTPTADKETLYFAAWSTSDAAPDERSDSTWGEFEFSAEERADASKIVAKLDTNGDGKLAFDEFPVSRARDAFRYVDQNKDGEVTALELAPLVETPKGKGNNLMVAVRAGGAGDISKSHVSWTYRRGLPYVSSPLLYQGRIYLVKAGGLVTCLDAESGKALFGPERMGASGEYYASPVGVNGQVILCSAGGTITVLRASDKFERLLIHDLGEPIHATPAVIGEVLYIRSDSALWAFGPK